MSHPHILTLTWAHKDDHVIMLDALRFKYIIVDCGAVGYDDAVTFTFLLWRQKSTNGTKDDGLYVTTLTPQQGRNIPVKTKARILKAVSMNQ